MRKKSHISLVKFIINNMKVEDLKEHKNAFYIGSILPDLLPSFITKRHTIDETFDILIEEIRKVTEGYDVEKGINSYYARHLGVITHYLADYCTLPHNSIYTGSMKDHVYYEKSLKFSLKDYVNTEAAKRERDHTFIFHTMEDIIEFIKETHNQYLKAIKAIKVDIHFIVELCYKVVDAIIRFLELAFEKVSQKQNPCIDCVQA